MNEQDRRILEKLIEYNEKRLTQVESHQITMNSEMGDFKEGMGELRGEMKWVKILMCASVVIALGNFIVNWLFVNGLFK